VDPFPDPLLLRKSGSAGNRTQAFGPVARNSDHHTTKAVTMKLNMLNIYLVRMIRTSLFKTVCVEGWDVKVLQHVHTYSTVFKPAPLSRACF
jgi:hypothetical protein